MLAANFRRNRTLNMNYLPEVATRGTYMHRALCNLWVLVVKPRDYEGWSRVNFTAKNFLFPPFFSPPLSGILDGILNQARWSITMSKRKWVFFECIRNVRPKYAGTNNYMFRRYPRPSGLGGTLQCRSLLPARNLRVPKGPGPPANPAFFGKSVELQKQTRLVTLSSSS